LAATTIETRVVTAYRCYFPSPPPLVIVVLDALDPSGKELAHFH
jgi:hypothetical protein